MDRYVSSSFVDHLIPFLALGALLAVLVLAINVLGRRLERHDEWLALLDVRVGNLDKDRKATWARQLERPLALDVTERAAVIPPPPLVPPPLPPRAPTLEGIDWEEELVNTEELMKKDTGRYPLGEPPKGPNDDS